MEVPKMTQKPFEPNPGDQTISSPPEENPISPTSTDPPEGPPTKTPAELQVEEYRRKEAEYMRRQQEQDAKISQLTNVVSQMVNEKNKKPEQTPEEAAKDFYRDPKKVIREVMEETVRPLNDFKNTIETDNAYNRLKARYKNDARYASYFRREGFESAIDAIISQSSRSGTQITEQFVESALNHTVGQIAVGSVHMPDPIADANRQPPAPGDPLVDNRQIPPYLAPSSPPSRQAPREGPKRRPLSENEDRIRREGNMSVDDWWAWQDLDSTDVIGSKIGMTKKEA